MDRNKTIERVRDRTEPWDILVIGGGATGVGCAVDAASRGYDVLLIEQHDFGKGTSSRSTKLVHGGVRYLAQGNVSLVRESLKERRILLNNAPHVVHKQEFIVPCYSPWQKVFYGTGLKIYDLLAGKNSIGPSRILSRNETLARLPSIITEKLAGGVLYYDAQFDDTRLLIDLALTAEAVGAAILNYTRAGSFKTDQNGQVNSVECVDEITGVPFFVKAKAVVNAAGVFSDTVAKMADRGADPVLTFSRGMHLVFDRKFLPGDAALVIPKTSDGRVLFCIPWHDHVLIGTTDTPVDSPSLEPEASEAEIDFVLETAAQYLAAVPERRDILSVWAGIRPLVKPRRRSRTSAISRGHHLFVSDSGLVTITGGKWTTYRRMAEDAVDAAAKIGRLAQRVSVTQDLAIDPPDQPDPSDKERLHPDLPYTRADVVRAVREEMAVTLEDVLARRTRALFLNADAAVGLAGKLAEILAEELGKDDAWKKRQIEEFSEVAKNYRSRPVSVAAVDEDT